MPVTIRPSPRLPGLDHTLGLMRDPYEFISRQCRSFSSDVFEMRLLLRLQESLLGVGGVQSLDGAEHTLGSWCPWR